MNRFKLTFLTFSVFFIFSATAFAQDNIVDASATVLANIDFKAERAVDFGNIQPDLDPTPTLIPESQTQTGVEGAAVQFGYLVFTASDGFTLTVGWESGGTTTTLDGADGGNTDQLDMTIEVSEEIGDDSANDPAGSADLANGGEVTINDTNGEHTLWIGGTLDAATGTTAPVTADTYSGTVTFQIDYTFGS